MSMFNNRDKDPDKLNKLNNRQKYFLVGVAVFLILFLPQLKSTNAPLIKEVPLSTVISEIKDGKVSKAALNDDTRKIIVTLKDGKKQLAGYSITYGKELTTLLIDNKITTSSAIVKSPSIITSILGIFGPTILIILFLFMLMRKGGGLGIGSMSSKKTNPVEVPTTRFSDIAGIDEVIDELKEVVSLINEPGKYQKTGAKVPKGYLLAGAPGTGKTMLARAVAGEAGCPFYSISGSDFVEIFVGAGAKRVRELFDKARINGKAIIFIDEIDAIGRSRGGSFGAANDERENTLNQLLVELDGFTDSPVVLIAATNRPDILDEALTRPGRFDRKIVVPSPDRGGREAIFKIHSQNKPIDKSVNFGDLAMRTPGLTGADIAAVVNEAALEAARNNSETITERHFSDALATSTLGRERKSAVITDRDREIVAYHEAGHTLCAILQDDADNPVSVSIVPRGPAGGVTWLGGSEHQFMTKTQAKARIVVSMGGRAAEEILLKGDFTQGAHGDLQGATSLATAMVTKYGMGKNMINIDTERLIGDSAELVNDEVADIINTSLITARKLLKANKKKLELLVKELLDKETLGYEEIAKILNLK